MKIGDYVIPEKCGNSYKLILKNLSEVELGPRNHYEGLTFEGIDLSGLSLTQCRFDRCVFTRCHISMTEFSLSQFSEVSFQDCFLQESVFLWTAFNEATLFGKASTCEIQKVRFTRGSERYSRPNRSHTR